jgi:hypothetical protein
MNATTGYYSIIQYCPDPARHEVANVGIVLLCPHRQFLETRMAEDTHHIKEMFPKLKPDDRRLKSTLLGIERRLHVDRDHFKSVDDLSKFAETRANALRLTAPMPVRVEEPEEELTRLFERLVSDHEQRKRPRIRQALAQTFARNHVTHLVREKVEVMLPVFERPITAPFGFQNDRFNLIQATKFAGHAMSGILSRAGQFALEGELLSDALHPKLGPLQLVVVALFGPDQADVFQAVQQIFEKKGTRLYKLEEADELAQEIRQTARPLDPRLFAL